MKYYTEVGRESNRFDLDKSIKHYQSGKEAISVLLNKLKLVAEDEVYINSTFDTQYVSSCVTSTIFNFCKPSKIITDKTKLFCIIHDFGFPNEKTFELIEKSKKLSIPVVEDCAQSAFSFYKNGQRIGTLADYAIYSLKKIIPYNNAGLLIDNKIEKLPYSDYLEKAANIRRLNYRKLEKIFSRLSIAPFKNDIINISPFLFPFKVRGKQEKFITKLLNGFDLIYWINLEVYSLPVHQLLDSKYFDEISNRLN